MKKALLTLAGLALAGFLAAEAMDDRPGMGQGGPGGPGMEQGGPGGPGGPGMGEEPIEAMKEKLGLTDAQVKKLKALQEARQAEMKPLHREMRDLMSKLSDQVEDKAADTVIEATLKDLKAAQAKVKAGMEKAMEEREAILTPTQRAKALLGMRGKMMQGMKERMKERREARGKK